MPIGPFNNENLLLLTAAVLGISCTGVAGEPRATTQPAPSDAGRVVTILEQMESAGRAVNSIRCKVVYSVEDRLSITTKTKYGSILFTKSDPHAMFLVHFDKTVADDIVHRDEEWWWLRDRWLWEAKAKSKTIVKREILGPGEEIDLFDLESSPIPMPFGQEKDQILKNFSVRLVDRQIDDPENCDHLFCTPKPGAPLAKEYQRLDYYVSHTLHLPVRIVAEDARGDKVTVAHFPGITKDDLNVDLSEREFNQPAKTRGFRITVEPRQPADSAQAP